jgi:hypothetical protein
MSDFDSRPLIEAIDNVSAEIGDIYVPSIMSMDEKQFKEITDCLWRIGDKLESIANCMPR